MIPECFEHAFIGRQGNAYFKELTPAGDINQYFQAEFIDEPADTIR